MDNLLAGRLCCGKYYGSSGTCNFENGIFLTFGNNFEELKNGLGQYTTAIIQLEDGKVIEALPSDITFVQHKKRRIKTKITSENEIPVPDNEIPSDNEKEADTDNERAKTEKKPQRRAIDHRKIRALKTAGWSNKDIAGEMHMTPAAVAVSLSTHKELIEELKKI